MSKIVLTCSITAFDEQIRRVFEGGKGISRARDDEEIFGDDEEFFEI